jgi:flagellar basal body-associated protein FliL
MVHAFRTHEYIHIKHVLIASIVVIVLLVGAAVIVYFSTKTPNTPASKPNFKLRSPDDPDDPDDNTPATGPGCGM